MKLNHQTRSIFYYLAKLNLSSCEYRIILYLLAKGDGLFECLIVNRDELRTFVSCAKSEIQFSLNSLQEKKILQLKYSHYQTTNDSFRSLSISINKNVLDWVLVKEQEYLPPKKSTTKNPTNKSNLIKMVKNMDKLKYSGDIECNAIIVVEFLTDVKKVNGEDKEKYLIEARNILEKIPFESFLFTLKHFYKEINSLSDLSKSWDLYQSKLQKKLNQIDFEKAKKEHDSENNKLRNIAKEWIEASDDKCLTAEECRLLEIISDHCHPRRQLFWAYRFKQNYPNLKNFFLENFTRMLPVTTKGSVVRKKD